MPKKKSFPVGRLKAKLAKEKPWAKLGLTRAKYESSRMWTAMHVSRAKFEEMLEAMPKEALEVLWEQAETEVHEEREAAKIDGLMELLGFRAEDVEEDAE